MVNFIDDLLGSDRRLCRVLGTLAAGVYVVAFAVAYAVLWLIAGIGIICLLGVATCFTLQRLAPPHSPLDDVRRAFHRLFNPLLEEQGWRLVGDDKVSQ